MLAKLIAWSGTREQAIDRMLRALGEYHIGGIKSNISLFQTILNDAAFRAGDLDTGYLDRLLQRDVERRRPAARSGCDRGSGGFAAESKARRARLRVGRERFPLGHAGTRGISALTRVIRINGEPVEPARDATIVETEPGVWSVVTGGASYEARVEGDEIVDRRIPLPL